MEGGTWTAGVLLYSGRRDPVWPIDDAIGAALDSRFGALGKSAGPDSHESRLGYRGAWIRRPDGYRIVAFNELVISDAGPVRGDPGRSLERAILETAPSGVLPMEPDALIAM